MTDSKCSYCLNPVGSLRIKCSECTDEDIRLCLECFACGAELGRHRKDHEYLVLTQNKPVVFQPVFTAPKWNSEDEQSLLDAVEQFGFGNWDDVAGAVKTKTSEECEEHYTDFYVFGSIGKVTYSNDEPINVQDHTGTVDGPLSPSLTTVLPPVELSMDEQRMLGYMPHRDDYERDFDNESEGIVAAVGPIVADEDDLEKATRVAIVGQYREKLRERQRRRWIARENRLLRSFLDENAKYVRQLAGLCKLSANGIAQKKPESETKKKSSSKDDKEFQDKMKIFAQFHSRKEHEGFFENLKKEKTLKTRIKELIRYRKNGISKVSDCKIYDVERAKRDRRKERLKKLQQQQRNSLSHGKVNGWKAQNGKAPRIENACNGEASEVVLGPRQSRAKHRRYCRPPIRPAAAATAAAKGQQRAASTNANAPPHRSKNNVQPPLTQQKVVKRKRRRRRKKGWV